MYCTHCGEQIEENWIICPKCGAEVNSIRTNETQSEPINIESIIKKFESTQDGEPATLTGFLRFCCIIKVIVYAVSGGFIGSAVDKIIMILGRSYSDDGLMLGAGITLGIIMGIITITRDWIFSRMADDIKQIKENTY